MGARAVSEGWQLLGTPATGGVLIVADHASAHVPADIDLGVPAAVMREHVSVDIGVAPLAAALVERLGCAAVLGGVSRLVIDLNREADAPALIPEASDGHAVPGNVGVDRAGRIARFWDPYHAALDAAIERERPALLVSLHSFTPRLRTVAVERPWQVGVLYNRDDRAARIAMPLLEAAGVVTGDNQPYSGTVLNATMNRHGEARGLPYLGLEVRQDLIGDAEGVAAWCNIVARVIEATVAALRGA